MIVRIVSGGQTGIDRAALDVAITRGMACGGWCPKGRLSEDGAIPAIYPLRETPTSEYEERTAWNVRDSDGTLVLTYGPPSQGTALTVYMARDLHKPCLVVDLAEDVSAEAALRWIREHRIATLNVAGPRASKFPHLYPIAMAFLEALLDLDQA